MTTGAAQPLLPTDWMELMTAGHATLVPQPPANQPAPAAARRAVNTAYYAAFHALTARNADALIGPPNDQLTWASNGFGTS